MPVHEDEDVLGTLEYADPLLDVDVVEAVCTGIKRETVRFGRGKRDNRVLYFAIYLPERLVGEYVRLFCNDTGRVRPGSKLARVALVALGRPVRRGETLKASMLTRSAYRLKLKNVVDRYTLVDTVIERLTSHPEWL